MSRESGDIRVAIAGAGVAGMTAALRLAERGYKVTLYEKSAVVGGSLGGWGGAAGVFREVYPHMFANWYKNFWTLAETDLGLIRGTHFLPRTNCKYLRKGAFPRYTQMSNVGSPWTALPNLFSGLAPIADVLLYSYSLVDLLSRSFTNDDLLSRYDVNGFMASQPYATVRMAELHDACLQTIWAIHSYRTSAAAYQNFIKYGFRHPTPELWVMNGSAPTVFVGPFRDRLERLGCEIETKVALERVGLVDGRVRTIRLTDHDGHSREQSVDHLILAVPPSTLGQLVIGGAGDSDPPASASPPQRIVDMVPQLAEVRRLSAYPIPVVNVYFKKLLPNIPVEFVGLQGSRYDLSFAELPQSRLTNGVTALAVAISDFDALFAPMDHDHRTADDHLNAHDIMVELRKFLPVFDPGKAWGDPNSDIDWEKSLFQRNTSHELFVNEVGSELFRPKASYPSIPNLCFAGDFCETSISISTIESAVMSGLQAAQALWRRHPRGAPIHIEEPDFYPRPVILALKMALTPYAYGAKLWSIASDAASAAIDAKEDEDGDSAVGYRELVRFIARASLASFSFGPRLWWRRAGVVSRYGVELVHALRVLSSGPGHGGEAQGILLDAVRAYFRTMAELPERESRRLQRALDRIAASVAGPDGSTGRRYVRRWSEKP